MRQQLEQVSTRRHVDGWSSGENWEGKMNIAQTLWAGDLEKNWSEMCSTLHSTTQTDRQKTDGSHACKCHSNKINNKMQTK